ncbi:DUF924 family protein [Acaryochloris marina]|uniref:DUF924 domain-containing protein n=1 Tax=Acaryochloris marina (strain MBIC 11017) TaxID=329726 RepID=B0CBX9_ACAM1|nr:DUF924 family protein [Acaryochloris marina]ABW30379.1 conserved hypothetical protein [Acaryochloris marina MBIC11017]BDM79200.1 hypothetical protein AM10699_20680 [Acaryochloris marina MBIC10699]
MESPETICEFWFGTDQDDLDVIRQRSKLWWSKNPDVDTEIKARFSSYLAKATNGELEGWKQTPLGTLALILLTDQFSRNMYRDTAEAFAYDEIARKLCKQGLKDRTDQSLRPIQRVFFYMPLEHSESLADQEHCIQLFQRLAAESKPHLKDGFEQYIDFAVRHRNIIDQFGRFPHRNALLNRVSTPAEIEFLKTPGSSF